jgi:hypothetical protein
MPMHTSLAPFGQVLRELCLFKPLQSREPLPGHCWSKAQHIAHGFTLMTPSLHGWEAFPTPGALTHTRITWALSPPAPQVLGVTPGSPLCPWCFEHPFGEVRDTFCFVQLNALQDMQVKYFEVVVTGAIAIILYNCMSNYIGFMCWNCKTII